MKCQSLVESKGERKETSKVLRLGDNNDDDMMMQWKKKGKEMMKMIKGTAIYI